MANKVPGADKQRSGEKPQATGKNAGPLAGIRVLDLTRILAGPTCTQLLGDFGADVIKVERPGLGDDTRAWGPPYPEGADGKPTRQSAYYLSSNRNKRSVTADISTSEGAGLVRRMARHCDVLVENFRRDSLAKRGLGYADLGAINPALIYCSITGFGHTGPNADKPGYDLLAQGFGGMMSLTGEPDGQPMKLGVAISDVVCGLYAATAILAAMVHRERGGEGQHIDIGLVDTQVACLVNEGASHLLTGAAPIRRGNQHPTIVPYQVFDAADGPMIVAVGNDAQYRHFCALLGRDDLATDPRYQTNPARVRNREALIPELAKEVRKMPRDALVARMEAANIPGGTINTLPEVFASGQVAARGMKVSLNYRHAASGRVDLIGNPVKFSSTPVSYRHAPPTCGEHTDEIVAELDEMDAHQSNGGGD